MILTIAIPTFRRPAMLAECLDSLLPQLEGGVEILVIDNDPAGSARTLVESYARPELRYLHEERPGVVQARNRAVRESKARYLGFIDDDEVARPGWIAALLRHVRMEVPASFGMVVPRFIGAVEPGLEDMLQSFYRRDLKRPQDADASSDWAYLGTGNSLFDKQACFKTDEPFPTHLNGTGGEDIWLIKSLGERGLTLRWNPAAMVDEQVPADRATFAYVRDRKYRYGQQRIIMVRGSGGPKGWARTAAWMGVGATQLALHGSRSLALKLSGRPDWRSEAARASGGLGKLLWWRLWETSPYAGGTSG
jgi:succinoglycan biosynthesis protein ExoM